MDWSVEGQNGVTYCPTPEINCLSCACNGRVNLVPVTLPWLEIEVPCTMWGQNSDRREQCRKRFPQICTEVFPDTKMCTNRAKLHAVGGKMTRNLCTDWLQEPKQNLKFPPVKVASPHWSFGACIRDPRMGQTLWMRLSHHYYKGYSGPSLTMLKIRLKKINLTCN